jgi:hypothetical protein
MKMWSYSEYDAKPLVFLCCLWQVKFNSQEVKMKTEERLYAAPIWEKIPVLYFSDSKEGWEFKYRGICIEGENLPPRVVPRIHMYDGWMEYLGIDENCMLKIIFDDGDIKSYWFGSWWWKDRYLKEIEKIIIEKLSTVTPFLVPHTSDESFGVATLINEVNEVSDILKEYRSMWRLIDGAPVLFKDVKTDSFSLLETIARNENYKLKKNVISPAYRQGKLVTFNRDILWKYLRP